MNLHLDKDAFRVLIENISFRTSYRADVLEKDYYVTLVLNELAMKQVSGLPAYFKGGTALYKALGTTNRFSEDIDLSVHPRDFLFFENVADNNSVQSAFEVMQRQYVLKEQDRVDYYKACDCLKRIKGKLVKNASWNNA